MYRKIIIYDINNTDFIKNDTKVFCVLFIIFSYLNIKKIEAI